MSHDIEDLLELIKMLEERIIELEKFTSKLTDNKDWYHEGTVIVVGV